EQSAQFGFRAQYGWFTVWLGEANLLNGNPTIAASLAREGFEICWNAQFPFGVACAQRALGCASLAAGRFIDAERHLEEGLNGFRLIGAQLEFARTHLSLASVALATELPQKATSLLAHAEDLLSKLQVDRLLVRVERLRSPASTVREDEKMPIPRG